MEQTLQKKYDCLRRALAAQRALAVAYSGGVDSTFLLAAAAEVCARVLAVTACTDALPRRELAEASAYAAACGIAHTVVELDAFAVPQFAQNAPDRCYHCKKALFIRMAAAARDAGFPVLCEGSNADDSADYRPGLAAIAELGIPSPLKDAGLTKQEIRALSQQMHLPTWQKPSYACLATRVPYGTPLTHALLCKIDRAEQVLHGLGFAAGRVRCHGDAARIELPPESLAAAFAPEVRAALSAGVHAAGFAYVALDLDGYRVGSFNETLPREMRGAAAAPQGEVQAVKA
ncbi:MAG: ATP-dependent sacrificial sulfur transferase LarE [Ruthenibacterium sp.]